MKKIFISAVFALVILASCKKDLSTNAGDQQPAITSNATSASGNPTFNLEVILRGDGEAFGLIKFRQDNDAAKIISLDTWVRDLAPGHSYLLQRAVDAINVIDGNCTSTSWLTLGKGLIPQAILTNDKGTGREDLWRSIAAIPTGSNFDIHFRVIDAVTMAVVLTSDCYEYTVR
ncbi:MAG: hypothetical protein ABI834_00825 [Ginsengibacter sp.]